MSKGINQESMLSVLPSVLKKDKGMYDLAQLIGWIMGKDAGAVDAPAIFQHIDQLPEELLDILAVDYKVDWYDYDADIATKRRQFADNWHVREHLGTVQAVKTAIQNVWPDSTVEEWFEYDGEPGYFQVLLNMTTVASVPFDKAVRMIDIFKPVRAHIDGYPILRVKCGIVIKDKTEQHKYHVRAAGTKPRWSTHGDKSKEDIVILTEAESPIYHVPSTGQVIAGTYPHYSTHGDVSEEDIVLQTEREGSTYQVPVTGQVIAGTHPDYATHGERDAGGLDVSAATVSVGYSIRKCGTPNNSLF